MIKTLFIIGFWIAVASAVFSIGMTLFLIAISAVISGISWIVDKVRNG